MEGMNALVGMVRRDVDVINNRRISTIGTEEC
jgi:hypothetical protein